MKRLAVAVILIVMGAPSPSEPSWMHLPDIVFMLVAGILGIHVLVTPPLKRKEANSPPNLGKEGRDAT